jgi:hypothetical protein
VAEVTSIGSRGVWLLVGRRELFLPYTEFPWFRTATVEQVLDVERPSARRLRWPSLDIDLAVESVEHPERFPLVSRAAVQPPAPKPRTTRAKRTLAR